MIRRSTPRPPSGPTLDSLKLMTAAADHWLNVLRTADGAAEVRLARPCVGARRRRRLRNQIARRAPLFAPALARLESLREQLAAAQDAARSSLLSPTPAP